MACNECLAQQASACWDSFVSCASRIECLAGLLQGRKRTDGVMRHLRNSRRMKSRDKGDLGVTSLRMMRVASTSTRSFKSSYSVDNCEILGSGGFGAVYKSVHIATQQERAVKVLRKENQEDITLLYSELEILIELDHPNVLRLYEYFEDEASVYVVTELATGGDLHALIKEACVSNYERQVINAFRQLMEALAYCHGHQIAHRDLKAENCLFTDSTRQILKVIDFGLSAMGHQDQQQGEWMKGVLGTPGYMSPEMIRQEGAYGVTTDVWSAGVILYLLFTGCNPFTADSKCRSNDELFKRISTQPYNAKILNEHSVSVKARDLIDKLLVKNPVGRPSAAEALQHPLLRRDGFERSTSGDSSSGGLTRESFIRLLKSVRKYSKASRFEGALLSYIAQQTAENELHELQKAFKLVDSNGDGSLSGEEIRAAFESMGVPLSDEDLKGVFEAFDQDDSGYVQYTEWLAATIRPDQIMSEHAIKAAFEFFDIDGNGEISRSELLQVIGEDLSPRLGARWGADAESCLSLEDFRGMVQELATSRAAGITPPAARTPGRLGDIVDFDLPHLAFGSPPPTPTGGVLAKKALERLNSGFISP